VGTAVSASVLILLGLANAWILYSLVQRLRRILREEVEEDAVVGDGGFKIEGGGIMVKILNKVLQVVDRPWKMYPVGVLFGLGFDTSSEIAVIGFASVQGAQGTSIWLILIFPVLFTGILPHQIFSFPLFRALMTSYLLLECVLSTRVMAA
jgi:nickel/cobalt transporter (NiCoT) family protein